MRHQFIWQLHSTIDVHLVDSHAHEIQTIHVHYLTMQRLRLFLELCTFYGILSNLSNRIIRISHVGRSLLLQAIVPNIQLVLLVLQLYFIIK